MRSVDQLLQAWQGAITIREKILPGATKTKNPDITKFQTLLGRRCRDEESKRFHCAVIGLLENRAPLDKWLHNHLLTLTDDPQPSEEGASKRSKWKRAKTFEKAEEVLNKWLEGDAKSFVVDGKNLSPPEPEGELAVRCAIEFWFITKLIHLSNPGIKRELVDTLFETYYTDPNLGFDGKSRLDILREGDYDDLVDWLLEFEDFGNRLKDHLDDTKHYKDFNKVEMSKSMIRKFSPFSSRYIIPRHSSKSRGYGFFVSGAPYGYDADSVQLVNDDFDYVEELFENAGLWTPEAADLYTKVSPTEYWSIEHLNECLSTCLQAITGNCSFLVFALNSHGDNDRLYSSLVNERNPDDGQTVNELLKVLSIEGLKGIPKVVVIQACQTAKKHVPIDFIKENLRKDQDLVDIFLVMTAKPGYAYDSKPRLNFIEFFAEAMASVNGETRIDLVMERAEAAEHRARFRERIDGRPPRSKSETEAHIKAPIEGAVAKETRKRKNKNTFPRTNKGAKAMGQTNVISSHKEIIPQPSRLPDDGSRRENDDLVQRRATIDVKLNFKTK